MTRKFQTRLGSILLALAMMLSMLPVTALAVDGEDPVAQIGENTYTSLTEALSQAENGQIVEVIAPAAVGMTETFEITGKAITLDLNGQTVTWNTSAKEGITVKDGGLTIQDTKGTGVLHFIGTGTTSYGSGIYTSGNSSLSLTGGTVLYEHSSEAGYGLNITGSSTITMTGGTVKIAGAASHAVRLASTSQCQLNGGQILFDASTTASTLYGVYAVLYSSAGEAAGFSLGNLTVDGSMVPEAKTVVCVYGYNDGTPVTISGGTYTANDKSASYAVGGGNSNATSISGGTFNGAVKAAIGKVTGGQFSVQPSAAYLPEGKIYELQQDGYYHVVDGTYVARLGTVGYASWDALWQDVSESTTASAVYILADVDEITVPAGKNVTFYNSGKCTIGKITNNGTCKIISYAMTGTEVVNNGSLNLGHEVKSVVNNQGATMVATSYDYAKVTGSITNSGTMTISKGSYLGTLTNDGTLTITGGTFASDVKDFCAEGYTTQQNREGTWDVMADVPHVAEIDGYWYGTLQAALSAAKDGDTVKLLSDITLSTKESVNNKTLTLDMNRHKITYGASGTTSSKAGALVFGGASNITITGNGSFDFDDTYTADSSKSTGRIFDVNNSSVLTIENGSFYAGLTCILVDHNAKAIVKGGTYSASQPYGSNWFLLNLQDNTGAQIQVYGGTFAQYNPAESHTEPGGAVSFCGEGYVSVGEEREGVTYYTVGPDSAQTFAAEVDGLKYVSLSKAVEAAKDGDTVRLLQKYDGEPVEISKAITIDLGETGTASDLFTAGTGYAMALDGTRILFGVCYTITFDPAGGTVDPGTSATVFGGKLSSLPTPTRSGYTFDGWFTAATGGVRVTADTVFTENTTIYAHWSVISSSGGGSSSGNKTETVTNPDGSTTTTVTRPDGSTTETTKNPDGSTEVVDTKKDGTVTTTITDATGNKTETVEKTDGTSQTTVTNKDGSSSTTTVSKDGQAETQVKLPADLVSDAADKDEAVSLPMPEVSATTDDTTAPTVTVDLPSGTTAKVEIPVENVTPGTVAILVKGDGTEEIVKDSVVTENGLTLTVADGAKVRIVDRSIDFIDVRDGYWAEDEIDFVSSRELFTGTSANTFSPEGVMTRAMLMTVLARYEGVDTTTGDTWYEAGVAWAMENGISDGTNQEAFVTREQLATMLYRYVGEPEVTGTLNGFADAGSVSDWAKEGLTWAVENGLINGMGDGSLNPQGTANRAQVAAILARFVAMAH